ncbi:MAG: hypothetical protein WCJ70_04605 [bacterium]
MITTIRSLLAGILIYTATVLSPKVTPTLGPIPTVVKQSPTQVLKIAPTTTLVPTVVPETCRYNKEQMLALMKKFNYSDSDIDKYFTLRPGNCFNPKPKAGNLPLQDLQQKVSELEGCKNQMNEYSSCMNRERAALEEYKDCINSFVDRHCSTPLTGFCFKPACSY